MDGEVHDGDEAHAEWAGQGAHGAGYPVIGPAWHNFVTKSLCFKLPCFFSNIPHEPLARFI